MIINKRFFISKQCYIRLKHDFMKKIEELPNNIPVFPLSNFIIFPDTIVPLNIFEQRYLQMIDDCMGGNKIIGFIQPINSNKKEPFIVIGSYDNKYGQYLILKYKNYIIKIFKMLNFYSAGQYWCHKLLGFLHLVQILQTYL